MNQPLILVSNDDGIEAPGLVTLAASLQDVGEVWVVAPDGERSTSSHSFTLDKPVPVRQVSERAYAVDGWPADCVYIGLFAIVPRRPDLVVSGINFGPNMGTDVIYSGTVAAAREAFTRGVAAVACSLVEGEDYELAGRFMRHLVRAMVDETGPKSDAPLFLNVNVPGPTAEGVRVTRLGQRIYPERAVVCGSSGERELYRLGQGPVRDSLLPGSDGEAHELGLISITPMTFDTTSADGFPLAESISETAWRDLARPVG